MSDTESDCVQGIVSSRSVVVDVGDRRLQFVTGEVFVTVRASVSFGILALLSTAHMNLGRMVLPREGLCGRGV